MVGAQGLTGEEAAQSRSPFRDLPWLMRSLLGVAPWSTALWTALILGDAAFTGLRLWAVRGTVNAVVAFVRGSGSEAGAVRWMVLIAAVEATSRLAGLLRPYVRERVRIAAGFAIQRAVLAKAAAVPVDAFDSSATHDVIRRVGEGADSRGPELVAEVLGLAQQVPSMVVYVIALGLIALWLPFAAVVLELIFIWQMVAQGRRERSFDVDWTRRRRLTDYYAGLLTSRGPAAEVRLWGLAPELLRRWRDGLWRYAVERNRLALRQTWQYLPSTVVASGFLVVAVAALSILHGAVEPGLAALFLTAFFGVMAGMNMFQGSARRLVGHAGYSSDLRRLLEALPVDGAAAEARAAAPPTPAVRVRQLAPAPRFPRPLRTGLRLTEVSYRYPGAAEDALHLIDCTLRPGEVVALVGANGAGKSTLAALLLGLRRPTAGRIEVDGVDMDRFAPADVRAACAAVFQQPVRYPATLRENVVLARTAAADAGWRSALQTAGLDGPGVDPDALLSPEFGGVDLSGGQWQRLSIARAIFRPEAQFLVFDEPTAALDPLAEVALFERFAGLAAGRTTLLVSHRLGPTRLADRVLVLDAGRLVEEGPPERLLAAGGLFAAMFEAQAGWYR